ncbi:hypothetical protein Anas_10911 [Armadillidium nasatum]|uniref:Uncharacterized protein n=1 Tax=Armadillidium nasatum TaxID=96803 RepID=A0A5N5TE96_9CRUS|nr:hypothetical protein Anas_10911 [Armadillidium nasatum]
MNNLIPQDTVHPLYSPSYEKLTDDFILDSLSTQTIDFNDPQLTSPQGVTIVSMSGKNLLFRKDKFKDTITVNGIGIENHQQLPDGTNVVILSDFLFNNYDKVQKAFQELVSQPGTPSLGPFGENRPPPPPPPASLGTFGENSPYPHPPPPQGTSRSGNERSVPSTDAGSESPPSGPETGLPEIPATFSSSFENDKFLNIWKFRLSKIQESSVKVDSRVPETILPVTNFRMINLVPQDAPHPLYSDKYQTLADNFILDSLSTEKIDFEDPNLTTPEGVVIKTFTGKDLVFKKDTSTDKITVNGIDIENHQLLSDQKTVVVLSDFLFNYYDDTKKAFQELTGGPDSSNGVKRSKQSETGAHSGTEHRTKTEIATEDFNVPQIPQDLEDAQDAPDASQFVFLWKNRLSNVEKTPGFVRTATQPKTVLVVEPFKMTNLIPQDAPHPLFSTEHADLTDRFILESLSTEDVNFDDPKLLTPEGLTIKTMNGKDLTFKKDKSTGKIKVNGIDVVSHKVLKGNTDLIVTSDHLFNIYDDVQTAFNQLLKTNTGNPWFGAPTVLPAVPKVLEGTNTEIDASGLVNVWENRLTKFGTTSTGDSGAETPKTVVAVSFIKMINLTPQDAPNPLYSEQYEHLANGFVLDSLSSQAIDVTDPALLSNSGKIIKTLSGRDLIFKKNEKTNKLTINGIEVENNKTFEDGTSVFVISDFLFDHQTAVRSAFDALLRESPKQHGLPPF